MTEQEQVDAWNRGNQTGVCVDVRRDNGEVLRTRTRSAAWLLGDHTAVILVEGIPGAYRLNRVTRADEEASEASAAMIDDNLMSRARSDIAEAIKAWQDYATRAGDHNDAEVARGVGRRTEGFLSLVESERELLRDALEALTRIETLVNQDASDEQEIAFLFERIHDAVGSILVRTR